MGGGLVDDNRGYVVLPFDEIKRFRTMPPVAIGHELAEISVSSSTANNYGTLNRTIDH